MNVHEHHRILLDESQPVDTRIQAANDIMAICRGLIEDARIIKNMLHESLKKGEVVEEGKTKDFRPEWGWIGSIPLPIRNRLFDDLQDHDGTVAGLVSSLKDYTNMFRFLRLALREVDGSAKAHVTTEAPDGSRRTDRLWISASPEILIHLSRKGVIRLWQP